MWKTFLVISTLFAAQEAMAAEREKELHLIIKYKQAALTAKSIQKQLSQEVPLQLKTIHSMAGNAFTVTFSVEEHMSKLVSDDLLKKTLQQLRRNPEVQFVVEDRVGHLEPFPEMKLVDTDTMNSDIGSLSHELQWDEFLPPAGVMLESAAGLLDGAWAYTTGKAASPVVVAVLDTGVALNDSLVNNLVKDELGQVWGWNFAGNNRDVADETVSFHGTHVAGTIAGYGKVMKGIGEDLKILPVKIPDASGMFYESQVINAIYWSVGGDVPGVPLNPYPASVLNMSFGIDEKPGKEVDHCDEALQEALFFARKHNAVVTVAAGNDNHWEHYNAPAVCNTAVKVASVGPEGLRAYYSNYGPSIAFAAPGGDTHYGKPGGILSTVKPGGGYQNTGFDFYQGTSMATPHVAGVAGLLFAVSNNDLSPERVEQILYATTHAFGASSDLNKSCVGDKPCGHGILDAAQAVKAAMANYDTIFSAPTHEQLQTIECGKNQFAPQQLTVRMGDVSWSQIKRDCIANAALRFPMIRQDPEGVIQAYYGAAIYQLNQKPFKRCDVIGVDGVGCYY